MLCLITTVSPLLIFSFLPNHIHLVARGLSALGFFGQTRGHRDLLDHLAGLTGTYQDGNIPDTYECGRFHFLLFGFYGRTTSLNVMMFSGLRKHGGTPPLAPEGVQLDPSIARLMHVLYPPAAMLDSAGVKRVGLASIPGSSGMELFTIPPEMTTPM